MPKWKHPINTPEYNSWKSMRSRCLYDSNNNKNHKLKGIKICERWLNSYDNFYDDMGKRPKDTTLDRIDPNGNYTPDNCRWADHRTQQNNKLNLTKVEHGGKEMTIGQWCNELSLSETEISKVYKRHSDYNAKTFDELFCKNLLSYRVSKRENKCLQCGTEKTCKWRKDGKQCNTCWHKEYRKREIR